MIGALLTLTLSLPAAPVSPPATEIIAHRGASWDAPENTLASVKLAWEQRADAVEFDVYLSKDGKIVLLHDKDLERTAGLARKVTELTTAELKKLDVGRWKGEQFAGERVPTLDEVLATVSADKRVFIEVKCGPEIVKELDRVVQASGLKPSQTAVISFSDKVIAAVKRARPELPAYWVVGLSEKNGKKPPTIDELIARAKEIRADGLDVQANPDILTPAAAKAITTAGLKLYVWTVNEVALARQMIDAGVEGITTDRPGWLREQLVRNDNDAPAPIRVMSFNIRYGTARDGENSWDKRKDFLVDTIKAFNPDLLGTQETLAFQRDFIASKLRAYGVVGIGRTDGKEDGEMMAVFYRKDRFEKLAEGHFWLSETPDKVGSKSWDSSLPRMVTWLKLRDRKDPEAPPIAYFNTHFDHLGRKARLESARLLRRKIAELGEDCRLLVTGDFNSGEGSEPYKALFGPLDEKPSPVVDTYRIAHPKRGDTEGTSSGFRAGASKGARIDWISCSRDWKVQSASIDRTAREGRTPSDHFPVTAVLQPAQGEGTAPRILRVLCYNIHHGRGTDGNVDLPRVARIITASRPDLVALQEVDNKTRRTNKVDQTAELARLTGLHGKFGKAIDFEGGAYGQAILSRHPLGEVKVHLLPGMVDQEQRIAVEVRVRVKDAGLSFITTHLHHQSAEARTQQARKLNALFGTAGHPIILVGDLNATPDSDPLKVLSEKWTIVTGDGKLPTYPASKPMKPIDHVLYRPTQRFRVVERMVLDEPVASDHRPVLVVLEYLPGETD